MLRLYGCIVEQHDLRLVVLAALICTLACYTALSLLSRGRDGQGGRSVAWITAAAVVFGSGVWATRFFALIPFQTGFPGGYDIGVALLSIISPLVISWLRFA